MAVAAVQAGPVFARLGRRFRAGLLRRVAAGLEQHREELVRVADSETGLGPVRLNGELSCSAFQFEPFADAVEDGGYLAAAIDHATDTVLGPQPDVRRMNMPVGPVAVFGSSNFPFAFSVLDGDVASALAAGCPVVAKAHSSHDLTSQHSFAVLEEAVRQAGAPEGTVGIVFGQAAGTALVAEPGIAAVGFTGSLGAAEALQRTIADREVSIPFFGELSGINPLVVMAVAATTRGAEIANGLFASYTGSGGQLCTKPGIAFVPEGEVGDDLVGELASLTAEAEAAALLNHRIRSAFDDIEGRLLDAGATLLTKGRPTTGDGFAVTPTLLITDAKAVDAQVAEECFGPLPVVARYQDSREVRDALERVPRSLTVTIHAEDSDAGVLGDLFEQLASLAGRIVYNGYPTGVRVSRAQTHGGPWPATNTRHTELPPLCGSR